MPFDPLTRAIAQQYEAFTAPRPRHVEGCECCTTAGALCALVAAPREELSAEVLDFYARKAVSTVGGQVELRYFWPRLAELAIAGEFTTDREMVFGKPHYAEARRWPGVERAALVDLARALGQWLGADELEASEVDAWVCSIGLLAEGLADVRPLLSPLLGSTNAASANLAAFIEWNRPYIEQKRRLSNAFWRSAPASQAAVLEWYLSEPRVADVMDALDRESARLYGTSLSVRRNPSS